MTPEITPIGAVIVAFNAADVIVGCVESLLRQRHGNPKVVVVDNASSDDTVAVLRDMGLTDAQIAELKTRNIIG